MYNSIKKRYHSVSIVFLLFTMFNLVIYIQHWSLLQKWITSCLFVLPGVLSLLYAKRCDLKIDGHMICMVNGLFCGMCADVLLVFWFVGGVVFFALGHVLYAVAFSMTEPIGKQDFCYIIVVLTVSEFIILSPLVQIDDQMMTLLLIGYAAVISVMTGKAVSNFIMHISLSNFLMFLGAVMFWLSDVALASNMFGNGICLPEWLCSITYWPGQSILAYSLFHHVSSRILKEELTNSK